MEPIFRRAGQQDLPTVYRMYRKAVEKMNREGIPQWDEIYPDYKTIEEDIRLGQMYLLAEGETVLAGVVWNRTCDPEYGDVSWNVQEEPVGIIHRLCVNPDYQNRGFAGKTLACTEDAMRREGYRTIRLDSFTGNPYANRLYQRAGYQMRGDITLRKGRFHVYEKAL